MPFHFLFFFFYLFLFFVKGQSLVPEQANEMEESKRRTARSCRSRKGTGEREKRNPSPFRALGDWCSHPPADRGLSSKWGQPRQWPQLRARTLMIHREDLLPSQERNVVMASLTQTSFTQRDDYDSDFLILFNSGISSLFFIFWFIEGLH